MHQESVLFVLAAVINVRQSAKILPVSVQVEGIKLKQNPSTSFPYPNHTHRQTEPSSSQPEPTPQSPLHPGDIDLDLFPDPGIQDRVGTPMPSPLRILLPLGRHMPLKATPLVVAAIEGAPLPRLHGVPRPDVSLLAAIATAAARRARAALLGKVLDQRRQRRDARHDDAQVVLDRRPQDQRRRVRVVGQALDRLDTDDLDDRDKEAEGEEAEEDDLFALLDLRGGEDGEGEGHSGGVG